MAKIDIPLLRDRLGKISQEDLGKRVGGVSQSTISRLESLPQPVEVDGPLGVLLDQLCRETDASSREDAA